jgi:hypothetical protein
MRRERMVMVVIGGHRKDNNVNNGRQRRIVFRTT